MSFRTETIKFIQEETNLSPAKKEALVKLVNGHQNNLLKLARWIRACSLFTQPSFGGLLVFQRLEMIRWVREGLGITGSSLNSFERILAIFFSKSMRAGRKHGYSAFAFCALARLRDETHLKVKAALVELLLSLPAGPLIGMKAKDYRAGLHHSDELVRCQTLVVLHRDFGAKGLLLALTEVDIFNRMPSLFFRGALRHLICQYPELLGNPDIRIIFDNRLKNLLRIGRLESPREQSESMGYPGWRLAYRLTCSAEALPDNSSSIKEERNRAAGAHHYYSGAFRGERFKMMGLNSIRT